MKKLLIPLSYLAQIIVLIGLIFFDGFGQQGFCLLYLIPFAIMNLALRNQISNKNLRLLHIIINVISILSFVILLILSFVFPVSNKYIILQTKKHSLSLIVISCVLFSIKYEKYSMSKNNSTHYIDNAVLFYKHSAYANSRIPQQE